MATFVRWNKNISCPAQYGESEIVEPLPGLPSCQFDCHKAYSPTHFVHAPTHFLRCSLDHLFDWSVCMQRQVSADDRDHCRRTGKLATMSKTPAGGSPLQQAVAARGGGGGIFSHCLQLSVDAGYAKPCATLSDGHKAYMNSHHRYV